MTSSRARKTRALDRQITAPKSEAELLTRAHALAGRTLAELAALIGVPIQSDASRRKGLIGTLVETALGARAGSAALDFPELRIELKTIPLARDGRPRESTFVCSFSPRRIADSEWERSAVREKLARVLWVPIESEPTIAFEARRVGLPRLWSPTPAQEAVLRADWEDLVGIIGRGDAELLTAHLGRYLQVRPKAAHARARGRGIDEQGAPTRMLPRGFYLRARFTAQLFR